MTVELAVFCVLLYTYGLFEWNRAVYAKFTAKPLASYPSVSVLIPCRNEARNIERCVVSLIEQDYPGDFEVIVFDDESDDGTDGILRKVAERDARLRVRRGGPLPAGWTGKNRGCHELSAAAKGEWILFVDADTFHEPAMLRRVVETAVHEGADLISTFPRQKFHSAGDEFLVPLMFFVLMTYLPMYFVAKRSWPRGSFSAACGQYLFFRKSTYEAVGGHAGLKGKISEAGILAAAVKKMGKKILLRDGSDWIACAMYRGFGEAWGGFSRSVFATMGGSVGTAAFFIVFQTFLYILPYVTLVTNLRPGHGSPEGIGFSLAAVALPIWIRYRIHRKIGMSLNLIGLHAVSIAAYNALIVNSFIHHRVRKNTSWKNRNYDQPQS